MPKLNHIRRYRFDDETNTALMKLGKKESFEVKIGRASCRERV